MIVMVILLVGIMTAIRIFPIGLSVNKSAEKTTLSSALANEVQDGYLSDPNSIMDNVVAVTPVPLQEASGTVTEFEENTNVSPYDLGPGATYPGFSSTYLSDPYFAADANKIHRVIGERVQIPPTLTDYFLKCGPFLDTKWDGMTRSLFIYGNPLYRNHQLVYDSNGNVTVPNVNGRMYAIDYGYDDPNSPAYDANTPPSIAFYPSIKYNQFFLISYVTIGADGLRHRIVDQIVYVPAVPQLPPPSPPNTIPPAVWQPLATVGAIVPYSETVSRMFVDQGDQQFDSDNPYEYEVVSPSYVSSSDPSLAANIGEILLNPAGYHYGEGSPNGSQYLQAHIDYDVYDWHILHEDRFMPSSEPYTITLGLTNIKKIGDMLSDQTKYTGLFYDVLGTPNNPTPDILVYDMNTGSLVVPQSVDYLNGTITFTPAEGLADATHTLRIYYQAHGSWAIQILKSSNVYSASGGVPPAIGEFFVRGNRIYFPICDMGKTVSIGNLYYLEPNPSNPANPYHRHSTNEAYQISSIVDPVVGFPYVDITTVHPDTLGLDMNVNGTGYSPFPVQNVQGVSFDVRVIHNNGAMVNESPAGNITSVRWNKYDLDTILSRTDP